MSYRDQHYWNQKLDPQDYRRLGDSIPPAYQGLRIDAYLGKFFLFRSRNQWVQMITNEQVLVNGKPVKASSRLEAGDQVHYFSPQIAEPKIDDNVYPVWEDRGAMVIYKPSGLPMHEAGAYRKNTFFEVVHQKIGPEWAAVHRLDRETSGLVLCANTTELRNILCDQLRKRTMHKTYRAITFGSPEEDKWICEAPLGKTTETSFRVKQWVTPNGLPAFTTFEALERKNGYTLLKASPKTGRTHQIRIHAAFKGLPLVGDKRYFPDESIFIEYMEKGFTDRVRQACLTDRVCLHACNLQFVHPLTKKSVEVNIDMPDDMKRIWGELCN